MSRSTFKQYLTELMVDIDPSQDPNAQIQNIRKMSMMAQRSPQTVAKQQSDQAQAQRTQQANNPGSDETKVLRDQIARMKEQLFRLQQQLVRKEESIKNQGAQPQQPQQPGASL